MTSKQVETAHVFEWDVDREAAIDQRQAAALLAALGHKNEGAFIQTFADADHTLYVREDREGKPHRWHYRLRHPNGKVRTGPVTHTGHAVVSDFESKVLFHECNLARVGVFFTVNALVMGARRRTADQVNRVRAVFVDLDGAPLPERWPLPPTAIVESSEGRFHVYWAVTGVPLREFTPIQKYLAKTFGGDPKVCDLPRVMRLPGYWHGKGETGFLVTLHKMRTARYNREKLLAAFDGLEAALHTASEAEQRHRDATHAQLERARQLRAELNGGTVSDQTGARRKHAQSALLSETTLVARAGQGSRNSQLFKSAAALGELVGAGVLDRGEVEMELKEAALAVGLGEHEANETMHSGLTRGMKKPRDLDRVGTRAGSRKPDVPRLAPEQVNEAPVAARKGYGLPTFPQGTQEGTDEANALILAHNGLEAWLRYSMGLGWYVWQAERGVWQADPEGVLAAQVAGAMLREVIGQYLADAFKQRVDEEERERIARWAKAVCNNRTVHSALEAAKGKPQFLTPVEAWDARPDLLNCKNGVLNLRTGELHPHVPDDLMTWQAGAAFDPHARHPHVDELLRLLREDGRHDFLQRSVGSTLYGEAPNEVFTVLQGEGSTGKGTLAAASVGMLGDYAGTIEVNLLLSNAKGETATGPKPELLMLRGKRLVVAGEPPKGARFNAGRVKGMTGNDPITARNMHSPTMVTFSPVFKLWIHTNYPIGAAHDDSGLQRRIRVVPFTAKPARPDPAFKRTLEHDPTARSALLNWALTGCRLWLASGYDLGESEAVSAATGGYWREQNPYERFAAELLIFETGEQIASGRLKSLFEEWAEENGATMGRAVKMADLHGFLAAHGCEAGRTKSGRFWYGVAERVTEVTEVTPQPQVFSTSYARTRKTLGSGVTCVTRVTQEEDMPPGEKVENLRLEPKKSERVTEVTEVTPQPQVFKNDLENAVPEFDPGRGCHDWTGDDL